MQKLHRRRTEISPSFDIDQNDYSTQTQRFSLSRKKLGLHSKFSKGVDEFTLARDHSRRKQDLQEFVKENFKRKECVHFVPKVNPKAKPEDPHKCHCGEALEKHIKWTSGAPQYFEKGLGVLDNDVTTGESGQTWSAKTDIQEFTTNAFGKIDFTNEGIGGHKASKYVRVADSTDIDTVIQFMTDHWNMTKPYEPNLIITVIGGAKNFKLDGKKKDIFNEGLVAAAQTTHAWIITSGCNMGVMKAVGEAVAEGQTYNWDRFGMSHTLRCIGIAPWGYVERNGVLVSKDEQGLWNASYKVSNIIRHLHPVSLNANHTHFLLVDDGFRGRYGGVADFRAALEKKICSPISEGGMSKHVVLVVVEGGTDAIRDVSRSLKQKIPVVLCEGTGRAADILSYAYNHFITTRKNERKISRKHEHLIEDMLVRAYGKTWEERSTIEKEQAVYKDLVLECCQDEKLITQGWYLILGSDKVKTTLKITVFDMNKNEDLDLAILSALLKGQGATDAEQLHEQLTLAVTWNRSDVAEEKIFNKDINWPTGKLDDIMTRALIEDKVNFVRLLLSNGVVMGEYLTVERLRELYNTVPKSGNLYYLLKQLTRFDKFSLSDVGKLLRKLIGKHDDDLYKEDELMNTMYKGHGADVNSKTFQRPFRELFLWAVLMNRQELARFLWERGDEAIPSAIVASKIYESIANKMKHYDHDMKEVYMQFKMEFEQLAVKVLDECHFTDPEKAAMLIERKYPTWGGMNCLELSSSADDKEFLSSVACQNSLNTSWQRGITSASWKVILCLVFPPLIFCWLQFEPKEDGKDIGTCQKVITFYRAPITKFFANLVMYFFFLLLYSYVILFDFRSPMQVTEIVVLIWILTMAMEEVREMFFLSESDSITERLKVWWNFSVFNRIDILIIFIALIGLVLRLIPGYFMAAKTAYAVNCVLFCVRILSFYTASSYLGPKLVMITRMLQELMLYIMILLVFLLAYGVSSISLQYPQREFTVRIFRDVFYYPYWQIYGELFLEELEGRTGECLVNNVTGVLMNDGNPCPQFSWLVPALTAGYLLIGNVLLLNLLIAIFTHIFDEIEQNSIQIWKFGMYFLVVEYDVKPGLAPPFVIFEHIFLVIRWLSRKSCCKQQKEKQNITRDQVDLLSIFEKECQKQYFKKRIMSDRDSNHRRILAISNRVDEVAKLLEEERMLEHHQNETDLNKNRDSHDSPKIRNSKSPRGSTADLKKLVAMDERREWNLNINPVAAEMSLEAKPTMMKDIETTTIAVPTSPRQLLKPEPFPLEKKMSNLDEKIYKTDQIDVKEIVDDGVYDQLDHQKLNKPKEDPDYGSAPLMKELKKNPNLEPYDSDQEIQKKRKHKKKKKKDVKDDEPRGNFPYETLNDGAGEELRNILRNKTPTPPPLPPSLAQQEDHRMTTPTPPPPPFSPPDPPAPLQKQKSDVEIRLAKLEENTQNKLYNIEALLRNMVYKREPEANDGYEVPRQQSQTQHRIPRQPAQPFAATPTTRIAFGGPLGGYPAPTQPAIQPIGRSHQGVAYVGPNLQSVPFVQHRSGGSPTRTSGNTTAAVLPRYGYMDSEL